MPLCRINVAQYVLKIQQWLPFLSIDFPQFNLLTVRLLILSPVAGTDCAVPRLIECSDDDEDDAQQCRRAGWQWAWMLRVASGRRDGRSSPKPPAPPVVLIWGDSGGSWTWYVGVRTCARASERPNRSGTHLQPQGKKPTLLYRKKLDSPSADWRTKGRKTQQFAAHRHTRTRTHCHHPHVICSEVPSLSGLLLFYTICGLWFLFSDGSFLEILLRGLGETRSEDQMVHFFQHLLEILKLLRCSS